MFVAFLLTASIVVSQHRTNAGETAPADESKSWATLGRLYVVIATDDQLEGVPGQTAKKNGETVEAMFRSHVAPGAYAVVKIPAEQMTRQAIFSVLSNLPLKPQDAVCLYVSGKGEMDRRHGMFFALSQGKEELYRMELRAALAKKGCRLNVLISDTCDGNSLPVKPEPAAENEQEESKTPAKVVQANDAALPAEMNAELTAPLFFSLFFQTSGSVDAVSALPTQRSLPSDQGIGCLTETWAALSASNKNKALSWYRFFPYLSRGTALLFEDNYVDGAPAPGGMKQTFQMPILLTLGQDDYSPDTFAVVYPQGKEFGTPIPGVTDNEIPLSDEGRNIVTQLVQATLGIVRPQNDQDKGTHEDYAALDPDNTVNGTDGQPFSTTLASLKPTPRTAASETTASNGESSLTAPPPMTLEKPRFGIQAVDNNGDGVKITRVFAGYPGHRVGLDVGDVILSIDGKKITSEKTFSAAVDACGEEMKVEVRNAGQDNVTTVKVPMRAVQ